MTVIFPKWTNHLPTIGALVAGTGALVVVSIVWYWFSPRHTDVGYQPLQPINYSHKLHVGTLGLDCRYCHHGVEKGPHATVPTTEVCMNCHIKVKVDSPRLALLHEKHTAGDPVEWVKVHMLPDYAYFDHSVHIGAGVGCASCHGRVDQMEVVRQAEPLSMGWCLECHRDPAPHIRPLDKITDMDFEPTREQGEALLKERGLNPPEHCGACHR